jgi:PAS domain S-box-containing protein
MQAAISDQHLPENFELFHNMVENARDGINITQNGDFKYVNKAFCDMLGYTREEMCCLTASDLLASTDKQRLMEQHFLRMQGIGKYGIDYTTLLHKNGSEVEIEFNVTPITYQGENASFISTRDITERKRMQEKLEQSEYKYRNLVENAHDGIIINQFGKFKFVNPAFCKMLEYSEDELLENDFVNFLAEDDRERLLQYHKLRMEGDRNHMIYEAKGVAKSGRIIHFEINTSFIEYNGHPATFIIMRDHTEQKALEETLKASEKKYRTLIEKSLDGILISQDSKIVMVNKAFADMLEYSVEECLEKFGPECIEPEDREWIMRYHLERMKGNLTDLTFTLRLIGKSGKLVITECSSTAIQIDGRPASLITSRDITSRIKMQEALEKSERKFRELSDLLPQIIYELDINGYVTYVNKTGREAFGMEDGDANPHASDAVIPEERIRMKENVRNALSGKRSDLFNEYTALRSDGTTFPAIIYAAPMVENDQIVGLRGLIVDISERKAMEEALRKSEQKFRELADLLPQTIFELDLGGNVTYLNKAGKIAFRLSENEIGFQATTGVIPEDHERLLDNIKKAFIEKGRDGGMEYTALRRDGSTFPIVIYSSPMTENNEIKGVRGLIVDISERKAMEEALRQSERKFRELADLLPQTVYELDAQGYGTYLNKSGQIAMGFTGDDIRFHALDGVIPEDRARMQENMRKTFQEKRLSFSDEYTALRKDGSTFPAIFYAAAMIGNGQFLGTRGLIIDISERKAMEEALRKSEEHYRHVIQSLQEGLFVLQDEKFRFVNDAIVDILGYTVEEMTGKHFTSVIPPELRDEAVRKNYRRRSGHTDSWSYEFQLLHKDGKTRIPVILSTNLTELDGKTAVVGTAKDITDRIKAEEEIKAAHKRLEEINRDLEQTIRERTKELTKANTQLLKLQKENLQSQFDVLKQQVNPHFLFNSLNVLISLIRLEPELAEKFTEHLAKVYRYVLENKDNELVNLSTEISFLDAYIFLINIRFMDKVVVNIRIPDDKKNHRVIPLAMQLLIENAIKHNAMSKKSPLVIDIFIDEDNQLNVVNNLQEREAHMTSTGVGLKNIQNRYRLLNNTVPVFEKTETHFIARIPLIIES